MTLTFRQLNGPYIDINNSKYLVSNVQLLWKAGKFTQTRIFMILSQNLLTDCLFQSCVCASVRACAVCVCACVRTCVRAYVQASVRARVCIS